MQKIFILFIVFIISLVKTDPNCCNSRYFEIIDDPQLVTTLAKIRNDFLKTRIPEFNRLDVAILLPTADPNKWRRAQIGGGNIAYPASCCKLPYALAAMYWCKQHNRPITCLDLHVRPMVGVSDNFETGVVVDITSGAPNIDNITSTSDPRYLTWIKQRQYTERLLESFGLLKNQRIIHKTYPSNSAWPLVGAEKVAREHLGMNMMNPCCSAILILEMMKGKILPEPKDEALAYIKSFLLHQKWSGQVNIGYAGLPPGTTIYNKPGLAYDTLEDIAYIILPNKQEFVISVFSNGYQRSTDAGALSLFTEMVVEGFGLDKGIPKVTLTADHTSNITVIGDWERQSDAIDKIGKSYFITKGSQQADSKIQFHVNLELDGLYEVSIYHPTIPNVSNNVLISVNHKYGKDDINVNQRIYSRYSLLGNFNFKKGLNKNAIEITNKVSTNGNVVVNAIKFVRHPYCLGAPGGVC